MMDRMKRVLAVAVARVITFLKAAFGDFHYQAPAWIGQSSRTLAQTKVGRWTEARRAWMRANKRKAWALFGSTVATVAAVTIGWLEYQKYLDSLPKPDYVEVTLQTPKEPDLDTGAVDSLVVSFSRSAAKIESLNKKVDELVTLKPAIKGSWHWRSDRLLEFTPSVSDATQWEIGKEYSIELSRKLFPDHVLLKELDYKFKTPGIHGTVSKNEFYQDPRDPSVKKAIFNITYNYVIDTEDYKKRIKLQFQTSDQSVLKESPRDLPYTVTFNPKKNEVYLASESLAIPKQDSVAILGISDGVRTPRGGVAEEKIDSSVTVPGMFNRFKFTSQSVTFARNEKFEPEQILVLQSKAEVASETVAKVLKVYLLPKHKKGEEKRKRNSVWESASEVDANVRKQLQPVKFTLVPAAEEFSMTHTFKIDMPVGRYLYVEIPKGLKSFGGYELFKDYNAVTGLPEYPRELQIMSAGSLLSLSGDKKIPLLARNLTNVDFMLYRILPTQLNQFVYQSYRYGGSFSNPALDQNQTDTLPEVFTQHEALNFTKASSTEYFSLDLAPYLNSDGGRRGLFFVKVRAKGSNMTDQRLIVVTDLGVIVKETNDGGHEVFVQNLRTGAAVVGADVSVIGANGLAVVDQKSSAEGRATFPNLKDFKNEKRPIAFVVKKDGDLSFLPYKLETQSLSYSKFDVGGIYDNNESDKLNAYLFSDRGIYRPGDAANIGMMIRGRGANASFKDVPITWAVTDARGTEIKREKILANSGDLLSLNFKTSETAATGAYNIQVFVSKKNRGDEQIGSLSVRVEEFMPDRMRISASLSQQTAEGWVSPENLKAQVSLKNLFGTPAENRRVVGEVVLNPARPVFKPYRDYSFVALKGDEKPFTETLKSEQTNEKGEASFDLDLARFGQSLYQLRFNAEGYETNGGRGVAGSANTLVSSRAYLVGIKSLDNLIYMKKGSDHDLQIIAIDPKLKSIDMNDLKTVLIERRYVSALMQQSDGTYKYQSVLKEVSGPSAPFKIAAKGTKFHLTTATPGDYALVVKDKADLELNRVYFSIAGEANLTRSLEKNAELQVTLDKKDYEQGAEIELQIKGPYVGAGLITIERDKVFASKWFKTSTTSTVEKIKIPAGVEGNAFVNVTFLRAPTSKEIFMSPLSYAVQPFSISLASKRIDLTVNTPALVKPGSDLKITYSASKPTKLILYGVDEGILQVAKYKLPDPLTFFFQRRALQVKTYQLLDLLLPEFSLIAGLSAPGGDQDGALSKNLNPFRRKSENPVVFWSGVIQAGPDKKTYSYSVPDYFNGNIKVMAVATNGGSYGAVEQATLSRGDFVITSNVPNFVVPGDEFEVGVGISNQAEGSGDKAKVKLELNSPAFEIVGPATQTVEVPEGRERGTTYKLKAKAMLGSQPLKFTASSGGKSAKASVETSVRPASPFMTDLVGGVAPKDVFEIAVTRRLLPEFRKQQATLSPVPMAMGEGLRAFLDAYPYGCSEQLTSKALPYVVLKSRPEFKLDPKKSAEFFQATLTLLRSRQTTEGGFGMYAADSANPWISLYVTQMLIEAKERGFQVPEDVLSRALDYTQSGVSRDLSSIEVARTFAYSRYLLTRAGRVPGNDLGFLNQALVKLHKDIWEQDVAAVFLAASYKLVKKDQEASAIIGRFKINQTTKENYLYFYDGFTRSSIGLYIVAKHFPELLKSRADDVTIRDAFQPLSNGLYNTHSASWSILALDAMFSAATTESAKLAIIEIQAKGLEKILVLPGNTVMPTVTYSGEAEKIRYTVPKARPYYYSQLQSGFDREIPKVETKKGLEITRDYLNEKGEPINSAKLGETIQVRLRIRGTDSRAQDREIIPHVVMVDLLPSGLEPILEEVAVSSESDRASEGDGPSEGDSEVRPSYHGDDDADPAPEPEGSGEGDGEGQGQDGALFQFLKMAVPRAHAQVPQTSISRLSPDYVDRREDRMIIYSSVPRDIREYVYKARAVAEGNFVIPPAFAEAMYDRSIQYRGGQSGSFKVDAP